MESRPRRPRLCVAPALALGLLGFGPCDDRSAAKARGAEEELTIVVEADKTRIAAEDAKLLERTRNLEDQKKQLDKQISDLEARKKQGAAAMTPLVRNRIESQEKELRASGAALAQEFVGIDQRREELVKQRDELLTKVTTGIAGGVESKSAILAGREQAMVVREKDTAGREKDVASREKAVAERERALADRERTVAAREASAGAGASRRSLDKGAEVSRAEFEAYYKKVLALMKSKGLQDEDLPSDKQNLTAEVQAARRAGDLSKALDLAESLDATVAATRVDHVFIDGKLRRVEGLMARRKSKLDGKTDQEIRRIFQDEVTRAAADGKYAEANQALNRIVSLVQR